MNRKITEKLLKSLAPAEKDYEVTEVPFTGFCVLVSKSGAMSFKLRYRINERKSSVTLGKYGKITLAQAKEEAKKHWADLARGIDPQAAKKEHVERLAKKKSEALGVFIQDQYKAWVEVHRKSPTKTLKTLNSTFQHWHMVPMTELTKPVIQKWQTKELERGLKPATVNRNLNALRGVLSLAVELGVLEKHPLSKVKNVREGDYTRVRFLSPEEFSLLNSALSERNQELVDGRRSGNVRRRDRQQSTLPEHADEEYADHFMPLVLVGLYTGLRFGELCQLEWADIDFANANMTVRSTTTKGNRQRHIPLDRALSVLRKWHRQTGEGGGLIFPNSVGLRLSSVKTAWAGLMKRTGIVNFRFHDLRHSFASQLVMKGVPLNTVRELLGHADIKTTLRYAHLADDHKAEAIALLY